MSCVQLSRVCAVVCLGAWLAHPTSAQNPRDPRVINGPTESISSLAFSPDGKQLAVGSGAPIAKKGAMQPGHVLLLNLATAKPEFAKEYSKGPVVVGYADEGKLLATLSGDKTLRFLDAATGKERFPDQDQRIFILRGFAVSPDGKKIATLGPVQGFLLSIRVWDASTGKESTHIDVGGNGVIAFTPDGKSLVYGTLAGKKGNYEIKLIDIEPKSVLRSWKAHSGKIEAIAITRDGKTLATASTDKTVKLWDLATGDEKRSFAMDGPITTVAFLPDEKTLVTVCRTNAELAFWDVATGKDLGSLYTTAPSAAAVSSDGKLLAVGDERRSDGKKADNVIKLWNLEALLSAYSKRPIIAGWGTAIDPDGDCAISENKGKVTIKVPPSVHDLYPGQTVAKRFNAPRVLQSVEGDFTVQVKVTSDWKPGEKAPSATSFPYHGAGLLIWDSKRTFIRLERNVWHRDKLEISYVTPLHYQDGKLANETRSSADGFFKGKSTWLRMERTGEKVKTAISHDGKTWIDIGELTAILPKTLQVGVEAVNSSNSEFRAEFEDLTINKK